MVLRFDQKPSSGFDTVVSYYVVADSVSDGFQAVTRYISKHGFTSHMYKWESRQLLPEDEVELNWHKPFRFPLKAKVLDEIYGSGEFLAVSGFELTEKGANRNKTDRNLPQGS